jgi:hypothetical protein
MGGGLCGVASMARLPAFVKGFAAAGVVFSVPFPVFSEDAAQQSF